MLMAISRTPYRVSFFGGGTDYPAWFRRHGGAVLSMAINKYCYIGTGFLPPFFGIRHRIIWSHIEAVNAAAEFAGSLVEGKAELETGEITTYQAILRTAFGFLLPGASRKFRVESGCNSCGECAEMCPVGNITMQDDHPVWGRECEICLRCINYCPQGAIELMNSSGRRRYKVPSFDPITG